jgi:hypothetical protein
LPSGIKLLRLLILWGAVGVFVGLWMWFFGVIWTDDAEPVELDQSALYVASAIGGLLGTFFGVSMGVERRDPDKDASQLAPGSTLLGTPDPREKGVSDSLTTAAVWAYALVGLVAIVTVFVRSEQAPGAVETLATTFAGFLLAIVAAAFAPGQAIGGRSTVGEPTVPASKPRPPAS